MDSSPAFVVVDLQQNLDHDLKSFGLDRLIEIGEVIDQKR
jgi:hypothetical protein